MSLISCRNQWFSLPGLEFYARAYGTAKVVLICWAFRHCHERVMRIMSRLLAISTGSFLALLAAIYPAKAQSEPDNISFAMEIVAMGGAANPNCPASFRENVCWCYGGPCGKPGHVHSSMKQNYNNKNPVGLMAAYVKCQRHRFHEIGLPGTPLWQVSPSGGRCTVGNLRDLIRGWCPDCRH